MTMKTQLSLFVLSVYHKFIFSLSKIYNELDWFIISLSIIYGLPSIWLWVNFIISRAIRTQGGNFCFPHSGYKVYWRTSLEKINGAYLLGETLWLIIIFNLHIYEKDRFESKSKGLICLCAVVLIPTPSLNCSFSIYNFE